jgi:hypothetical protein
VGLRHGGPCVGLWRPAAAARSGRVGRQRATVTSRYAPGASGGAPLPPPLPPQRQAPPPPPPLQPQQPQQQATAQRPPVPARRRVGVAQPPQQFAQPPPPQQARNPLQQLSAAAPAALRQAAAAAAVQQPATERTTPVQRVPSGAASEFLLPRSLLMDKEIITRWEPMWLVALYIYCCSTLPERVHAQPF